MAAFDGVVLSSIRGASETRESCIVEISRSAIAIWSPILWTIAE
jgi:hypothetical protein